VNVRPTAIDWTPDLPIFASEPYLKAAGDAYGWIGGSSPSGTLKCVLPYTVTRKAGLRIVRFRVATIPLGDELDVAEEKAFLDAVIEHFRAAGMDMVVPAPANVIFRTYPQGAITAPYGTYVVDLRRTEEELWAKLHSKHRNVVRNAIKNGVQVLTGAEHYDTAYELVRDTLTRSKLGFMSRAAFERYVRSLGDHVKVLIAQHEGKALGCAVLPFSQHGAHYVYGGTTLNPLTGAMNLLHWEAMRQFREQAVQRYDFVGARINPEPNSKQAGLVMFKQRFGGELNEGFMWKYSLRPLKFAVYSLAMRYLRGGDVVDQERARLQAPLAVAAAVTSGRDRQF
jgi:hypothetical protein